MEQEECVREWVPAPNTCGTRGVYAAIRRKIIVCPGSPVLYWGQLSPKAGFLLRLSEGDAVGVSRTSLVYFDIDCAPVFLQLAPEGRLVFEPFFQQRGYLPGRVFLSVALYFPVGW